MEGIVIAGGSIGEKDSYCLITPHKGILLADC